MFLETCKLQDKMFASTGVEFDDYEESLRFYGQKDAEVAEAIRNLMGKL